MSRGDHAKRSRWEKRAPVGLLVGRGNAGKSLLFVNFLDFLGVNPLVLHRRQGQRVERLVYSRPTAESSLVSGEPGQTAGFYVGMAPLSSRRRAPLALVDSTAILVTSGEWGPPALRRAVGFVQLLLHVVDASELGSGRLDPLDQRLMEVSLGQPGYLLLANKVDRPWGSAGVRILAEAVDSHRVLPLSARTGRGFRELRSRLLLALSEVKDTEAFPNRG